MIGMILTLFLCIWTVYLTFLLHKKSKENLYLASIVALLFVYLDETKDPLFSTDEMEDYKSFIEKMQEDK